GLPQLRVEGVGQSWFGVEVDELIRANAADADAIIDLDAEPRLADPFDPELREADGVHFTALGANLVAVDHLVPAVQSLRR
ncbi:MAG: hypothetical protein AAFN30_03215, partial [Actinomycetota bacterium]